MIASALATLVAPLPADAFLRDHWERAPLHQRRGDADHHAGILTNAQLEALIASSDLRYPAIQLARGGGYFPPEVYTRTVKFGGEAFAGVPDVDKIWNEYRAGATVVLPALHRTWPPLRALCARLEGELDHAVHANAYLTAAGTTGFTPHYDTHEVFVLQIAGGKQWTVYPPPLALPHRSQPFQRAGYTPPAPLFTCELATGDTLYLPRGYVHRAQTSDRHSVHVTIGVTVYTWVELLSEWVQASTGQARVRAALPPGFASTVDRAALAAGLRARLAELGDGDVDRIVDAFVHRVRDGQPRGDAQFRADVRVIGPATVLRAVAPARYRIAGDGHRTTLELDGRTLVLPAGVRATLDAICARGTFRVDELPAHLDAAATLAFVRFLEAEGFVAVA
jgi:ribosomal protein L16 Arg81 hydroxylase